MFISHDYKFIFIKTRKTAGSSIEKFFYDTLKNTDFIFAGMPPENLKPVKCNFKNPEHKGQQFIRRHFGFEWNNYFKFTIERNSWDKVVSTYHWQKRQMPNIKHTDFTSYILNGKKLWNKKDWRLYTSNDEICVDKIIRFESLSQDFLSICNFLNIPYNHELTVDYKLKGNIRPKDSYKDYYNKDTKQIVEDVFNKEINFFDYKF